MILGSLGALLLGIAVAYPFLATDLSLAPKTNLSVDVVYAYFGVQQFPSNVAGMWRNYSDTIERSYHIVSYLVVLNITNHSNQAARINDFTIYVAPQITVGNGSSVERTDMLGQQRNATSDTGTSVSIVNPIVADIRHFDYSESWNEVWQPNSSRLIGLSGITEVQDNAYPSLQSGDVYLYGRAEGEAAYARSGRSEAYSIKRVQLEIVGDSSLYSAFYNSVLRNDQYLGIINGLDVYIHTRR